MKRKGESCTIIIAMEKKKPISNNTDFSLWKIDVASYA